MFRAKTNEHRNVSVTNMKVTGEVEEEEALNAKSYPKSSLMNKRPPVFQQVGNINTNI